jgi:hypothetical protein
MGMFPKYKLYFKNKNINNNEELYRVEFFGTPFCERKVCREGRKK